MKKILLIGKNGQVGWHLHRSLASIGHVAAYGQRDLDICNEKEVRKIISEYQPHCIVNAAAYTAVDQAETDREKAFLVNGHALKAIGEEADRLGALLVHFSTDYVFDGNQTSPYKESQATSPINAYGESKLAGEQAIARHCKRHLIFRTSWVYDARGKNFLLTMLRLAKERPSLKIVDDQTGAPTWARTIADAASQAAYLLLKEENRDLYGIYNLTCRGQTSWKEFARNIFRYYKMWVDTDFMEPEVAGIPSSEYKTPAKRPAYSVLCHEKTLNAFNFCMPEWEAALQLCIQDLKR